MLSCILRGVLVVHRIEVLCNPRILNRGPTHGRHDANFALPRAPHVVRFFGWEGAEPIPLNGDRGTPSNLLLGDLQRVASMHKEHPHALNDGETSGVCHEIFHQSTNLASEPRPEGRSTWMDRLSVPWFHVHSLFGSVVRGCMAERTTVPFGLCPDGLEPFPRSSLSFLTQLLSWDQGAPVGPETQT
eukprot:scaffold741_cov336-Pavlova_lutheri.AAC.43